MKVDVSYFLLGAVRLLDPGNQQDAPGATIHLQVSSLNAAAGQSPGFSASNLPPGLSISGGGLISGTISSGASGSFGVTVSATYPSGGTGSVSFTWTVAARAPAESTNVARTLAVAFAFRVPVRLGLAVPVAVAVGVPVAVPVAVTVALGFRISVRLAVTFGHFVFPLTVAVPVRLGLAFAIGVGHAPDLER